MKRNKGLCVPVGIDRGNFMRELPYQAAFGPWKLFRRTSDGNMDLPPAHSEWRSTVSQCCWLWLHQQRDGASSVECQSV